MLTFKHIVNMSIQLKQLSLCVYPIVVKYVCHKPHHILGCLWDVMMVFLFVLLVVYVVPVKSQRYTVFIYVTFIFERVIMFCCLYASL